MAAASAEATASKTAATLSAAEAAAAGRGGLMLGAHGAGTGMAAIPGPAGYHRPWTNT